jgi:hypothetical protein
VSRASASRATSTSLAPASAAMRAVARPMPLPLVAPVSLPPGVDCCAAHSSEPATLRAAQQVFCLQTRQCRGGGLARFLLM